MVPADRERPIRAKSQIHFHLSIEADGHQASTCQEGDVDAGHQQHQADGDEQQTNEADAIYRPTAH